MNELEPSSAPANSASAGRRDYRAPHLNRVELKTNRRQLGHIYGGPGQFCTVHTHNSPPPINPCNAP